MLYAILIFIQVVISALLVIVILMQAAKGGGLAGIAGGLTSSPIFGGRSAATFLSRATTILAVLFMLNCLTLSVLSKARTSTRSVTQTENVQPPVSPVPSTGTEMPPSETGAAPSEEGGEAAPSPAGTQAPSPGGTAPSQQPSSQSAP
jgi:preprotein translocase subunit SecG